MVNLTVNLHFICNTLFPSFLFQWLALMHLLIVYLHVLILSRENILSAVRDNNADSVADNIHKLKESVNGDYSQSVLEQVLQKAVQEGCCGVIKVKSQ